ncbi:MAG: murein biosynthesis integral membrane protein MurJ [candidate division WOR-3 bacterium]
MPESQDLRPEARFTRRVGSFTIGTLISRITGVVRESVFAYLFGAGLATDAFNVAFRIPNFLRDLFAESALSAAFVPTFVASLKSEEPDDSWRFAANMLNALLLVTTVIVLLGMLLAPQIVNGIALGFAREPGKLELTALLTRIMFPFLLFVALAAWAMGILNACGTFFIPAVAPAAFNIFSALVPIATFAWLRARGIDPILGMAWGVLIGALAQFAVQLPRLFRHGFRYRPVLSFGDPRLRQVFFRWVPVLLGLASWQVMFLVNTFLMSFLPQGAVTWIFYAYRLQHLPAGLFGVAVGSVALAEYSHLAGGSIESIRSRFRHAMNLVSVLTLPAALLLLALAVPVVRLVYQHGRFTALDTAMTAQALALYCLGIWAGAATRNCAAGFYSLGDTKTPALVAAGCVVVNIMLNLVLMRHIGFRSFPLNLATSQLLNFAILFVLLRRRTGGLEGWKVFTIFLRTIGAALVAGLAAFLLALGFERLIYPGSLLFQLAQVLGCGAVGLLIYYRFALWFGVKEVRQALADLFRRSVQ